MCVGLQKMYLFTALKFVRLILNNRLTKWLAVMLAYNKVQPYKMVGDNHNLNYSTS